MTFCVWRAINYCSGGKGRNPLLVFRIFYFYYFYMLNSELPNILQLSLSKIAWLSGNLKTTIAFWNYYLVLLLIINQLIMYKNTNKLYFLQKL